MTLVERPIEFSIPENGLATVPAEIRGRGRDDVRLMVVHRSTGSIQHDRFDRLEHHLRAGDALVVNVSATIPAAIGARTRDGRALIVHFNGPAQDGLWSLEVRTPLPGGGTAPGPDLDPQSLTLEGGAMAQLLVRSRRSPRLWIASMTGAGDVPSHLAAHGGPIRYVAGTDRPIADYQTVFAIEDGSSEMPSAGRPFTHRMVTRLVARGIVVLPLVLHTGVSSFEDHEVPGEERFSVPKATADVVNRIRESGGRVVAVGTTVVRALETVADETGHIHPASGMTDLVVTADRGVRAIDGLITGWHEPRSSHLRLLEAFAGYGLLQDAYAAAVEGGYLWHEFGDELALLP